ncbi:MAG: peptidoglycan-binding protein [Desulfuromonadales bacterium]|nr:peptidoglycan-binding protein [Desulfuromonadales bacterium]
MKKSIFITATVLMSCFGLAGLTLGSGQDSKADKSSAVGSGMESSGMATMHQQKDASSLSEKQVRELQNLLKEEGYEVGDADGIIGQDTTEAIRQFQTDRDLEVTGIPNEKTLRSLAPDREQQEFFGLAPEFGEKEGMMPEKEGMTPEKKMDAEPMKKGY